MANSSVLFLAFDQHSLNSRAQTNFFCNYFSLASAVFSTYFGIRTDCKPTNNLEETNEDLDKASRIHN